MLFTATLLILVGIAAGALTTIASLGGGILLIAILSLFWSPVTVLGVTAPALFIGNASRVAMLSGDVDWRVVGRFSLTSVPAALGSSLVAASLPADTLGVLVAIFLLLFVLHEVGMVPLRPLAREPEAPARAEQPRPIWLADLGGAIAGIVSGLAGGAGFVSSPFLHAIGLPPRSLVATSAACMGVIHLAKGAGFTFASVLTPALFPQALTLAIGIVGGNALGTKVLDRMSRETFRRVLIVAVALAALQLLYRAAT